LSYIVTEDGVRLHYRTAGSGPDTVVVPNAIYLYDQFQTLAHGRTLIFFDMRNRGQSDSISDPAKLSRGIHHDVDDIETVRRHFGVDRVDLIGHSYLALVAILYAMRYPEHVNRIVQIGPPSPFFGKQYPPDQMCADAVLGDVWGQLGELQKQRESTDPIEFCRKWWAIMLRMFVADGAGVSKIADWGFCDFPNERNFMGHFMGNILPSLQALTFMPEDFAKVTAPVLTIHGRKDRNSPYGGGMEWSSLLPHARLVTVENGAHVPWIEAPEMVFGEIERFYGR